MQVRKATGNEPPFHVPTSVGKALVLSGVAVEVLPTVNPKLGGTLDWAARRGPAVGDTEDPPYIVYSTCPSCGCKAGWMHGPTVHLTQRIFHCNAYEAVPKEVAEQYVALYRDFKRRQARRD
jgi:hypothetical protein